jgi:hypothetical protein
VSASATKVRKEKTSGLNTKAVTIVTALAAVSSMASHWPPKMASNLWLAPVIPVSSDLDLLPDPCSREDPLWDVPLVCADVFRTKFVRLLILIQHAVSLIYKAIEAPNQTLIRINNLRVIF